MNDITKTIKCLKELEEKATPGTWEQSSSGRGVCTNAGSYIAHPDYGFKADAALIVAMRNVLPELLHYAKIGSEPCDDCEDAAARAEQAEAERSSRFTQGLSAALYATATSHDSDLGYLESIANELGYKSAKVIAEAAGDDVFLELIREQEAAKRGAGEVE